MKHIVLLIFILYNVKDIFEDKLVCFFLNIFVLSKVDEISVNICKYSQISVKFLNI